MKEKVEKLRDKEKNPIVTTFISYNNQFVIQISLFWENDFIIQHFKAEYFNFCLDQKQKPSEDIYYFQQQQQRLSLLYITNVEPIRGFSGFGISKKITKMDWLKFIHNPIFKEKLFHFDKTSSMANWIFLQKIWIVHT